MPRENNYHHDGDDPQFPATLNDQSGVRLTFGQLWTLILSIGGAAFLAALGWLGVKVELSEMRHDLWTNHDERAVWMAAKMANPTLTIPDVDEVHRNNRR